MIIVCVIPIKQTIAVVEEGNKRTILRSDDVDIKKVIEHNDIGQKITVEIQLEYGDLIVHKLPKCCSACPVGFSRNASCGRNVPFDKEDYRTRPKTCKLTELNLVQLLYGAEESQ